MTYIWQHPEWPEFRYDLTGIEDILLVFAEETGHISGILKGTPNAIQVETLINTMVAEAIKTSEIEGEFLSRQDVVSSIRNNLGIAQKPEPVKDRKAQGAGELMVTARNSYAEPLTETILFSWHQTLLKGSTTINIGAWRKDSAPMQVVSGSIGREKSISKRRRPSACLLKWHNLSSGSMLRRREGRRKSRKRLCVRPLHICISKQFTLLRTVMAGSAV